MRARSRKCNYFFLFFFLCSFRFFHSRTQLRRSERFPLLRVSYRNHPATTQRTETRRIFRNGSEHLLADPAKRMLWRTTPHAPAESSFFVSARSSARSWKVLKSSSRALSLRRSWLTRSWEIIQKGIGGGGGGLCACTAEAFGLVARLLGRRQQHQQNSRRGISPQCDETSTPRKTRTCGTATAAATTPFRYSGPASNECLPPGSKRFLEFLSYSQLTSTL